MKGLVREVVEVGDDEGNERSMERNDVVLLGLRLSK